MFSHLWLEDSLADLWELCALIGWSLNHQVEDYKSGSQDTVGSLVYSIWTGGKSTVFLPWAGHPASPLVF